MAPPPRDDSKVTSATSAPSAPSAATVAEGDGGAQDAAEAKEAKAAKRRQLGPVTARSSYSRVGEDEPLPEVKHRKALRRQLQLQKELTVEAARRITAAEILLPEKEGYLVTEDGHTQSISQGEILAQVDIGTQQKVFDLPLSMGPYSLDFARNGRHLLFGGEKGSMAMLDTHVMQTLCEVNVKEQVHDVKFLHNNLLWAAAQKKHAFIYDSEGTEIHCLRQHRYPLKLDFLPYHFLLTSVGQHGELRYQDITCGETVAVHKTGKGACRVMRANPGNAVVHLGHNNGAVTLWTPNMGTPVVEFLAHKGALVDIVFSQDGRTMYTAGLDGYWKVWDSRKFASVASYACGTTCPTAMAASANGSMVAIAQRSVVKVWKDVDLSSAHSTTTTTSNDSKSGRATSSSNWLTRQAPPPSYIHHQLPGEIISRLQFQPFEDILCVGHTGGVGSIIVPGSAIANFDSFEANPFETDKQRKEREVHQLLEKIPADMITLDPDRIGGVDDAPKAVQLAEQKAAEEATKKALRRKNKKGRDPTIGFEKAKSSTRAERQREAARDRLDEKHKTSKAGLPLS